MDGAIAFVFDVNIKQTDTATTSTLFLLIEPPILSSPSAL